MNETFFSKFPCIKIKRANKRKERATKEREREREREGEREGGREGAPALDGDAGANRGSEWNPGGSSDDGQCYERD